MTKEQALAALEERRQENRGKQINNASLPAGSPMYFYCQYCCGLSDELPEAYTCEPNHVCGECAPLVKNGWLKR